MSLTRSQSTRVFGMFPNLSFCLIFGMIESMKKPLQLKNIVWKEGKYFVAQCLNVDVSSFGKTKREASLNLQEALELYFEDAKSSVATKVERPEIFSVALRYA